MMKIALLIFAFTLVSGATDDKDKRKNWSILTNPLVSYRPCKDNSNIQMDFEPGLPPDEENSYKLFVYEELPLYSQLKLRFDSEATIILSNETQKKARVFGFGSELLFNIQFYRDAEKAVLRVKGPPSGTIPYITSLTINSVDYCKDPKTNVKELQEDLDSISRWCRENRMKMNPRKCFHIKFSRNKNQLLSSYNIDGIILDEVDRIRDLGVTLDSKLSFNSHYETIVSRAFQVLGFIKPAHCTTINGVPVIPEILSIIFGKYNLIGGDTTTQERKIHAVTVHAEYNHRKLNNDISLLQLKSEVVFDDYVQPACLWHLNAYKNLPFSTLFGTVVGWGFDHTDQLSSQLHQTIIPMVSEAKCIKSNPSFFGQMLTDQKFCAGYRNGTSACNGDSGGSFMVFVPDVPGDESANATGSWHIRGIVSVGVSRQDAAICDATQYTLFVDVSKYREWIENHMT
ncbi:uncharacterized protein ACR2FA_009681 [Aphomia sociella]